MPIYSRKIKYKKDKNGNVVNRASTVYDVYFKYNTPEGSKTYAKRGFIERKEAQEHEAKMRLKLAKPTYSLNAAEEGKKPLKEYLANWLEQYAKSSVRPNTYGGYERNIRLHVNPTLGDAPLNAISAPILDQLYRKLLKSGLAVNTVKYVHRTLSIALQHAVSYQYIESNPTRNTLTKFTSKVKTPAPYTIDQMHQLLEGVKDTQWEFIIVLGGLYGMRRNEVLGLQWNNVDRDQECFHVVDQLAGSAAKNHW
jgi:integrase